MIFIVLPAYNEEASIGNLLETIGHLIKENHSDFRVIVVDDGSKDKTCDVVRQYSKNMPVELIKHPENRGLGDAIKTGLLRGIEVAKSRDVVITMDSDNTHNPELIIRMFRMIREGYDVVIASRYQPGARVIGVPMFRNLLSYGASVLLRLSYPIKGVKDYTCGYRAYRAEVLQKAWKSFRGRLIERSGFVCMVELLLKLRTMSLIMGEVPLVLRYDQKHSASKMAIRKNTLDILTIILTRRYSKNKTIPETPLTAQHTDRGKR